MKKLSMALLAMLMIASLFISCDNSTKALTDELVEVRIGTDSNSRGLDATIDMNDEGIEWHYSATKVTERQFKFGETTDTALPAGNVVTFSQGRWDFGLWAIKDGKKVYSGTISNVLITKNADGSAVPVVVPVSPYTGDTGYIVLSNVKIHAYTGNETIVEVTPNFAAIDDVEITYFTGSMLKTEYATGSHKVEVAYKGTDDVVYASETIYLTVYSGRTTTVNGFVDEITGSAEIGHESTVAMVAIANGVKPNEQSQVSVAVTPSMDKGTQENPIQTTVTFPEGSFTEEADKAVLTLNVKPIDSNFSVGSTSSATPVAGIDIALMVNDKPVTSFNENEVTISTYIAKGLSDVKVYYNGTVIASDTAETDIYNSETGKLTFTTTHFSEFYVGADKYEAYNVNKTKVGNLSDLISDASVGDTVKLAKNVVLSSCLTITKDLVLDLNGYNIQGGNTWALFVNNCNVSIIGNGVISVSEGIPENYSVIYVGSGNNKSYLRIGENVKVESQYSYGIVGAGSNPITIIIDGEVKTVVAPAISGNGTSSNNETNIIINGTAETTNENAIYQPQAGILTINGTVTGGIEAKSGVINVKGTAIIKANSTGLSHDAYSNGCSTQGYAIAAVNNDDYKGNVVVDIADGASITGTVALIHDSDTLSEGKQKAVIHSQSNSYTTDSNSLWVKLGDDEFFTLMEKWDGYAAESYETPVDTTNKIITIASAEEFALFGQEVKNDKDTYANGYTVVLTDNIDFIGKVWTPIKLANGVNYNLILDGNNNEIRNLFIYDYYIGSSPKFRTYSGLFETFGGTIKDLTVVDSFIVGERSGVLIGASNKDITIQNVIINNAEIRSEQKNGGLIGYVRGKGNVGEGTCKISNCNVSNVVFKTYDVNESDAPWQCGGLYGYGDSQYNYIIENNTVSNISIVNDPCVSYPGLSGLQYASNEFIGNVVNMSVVPAGETASSVYGKYTITLSNNTVSEGEGFFRLTIAEHPEVTISNKYFGSYYNSRLSVSGKIITKIVVDGKEITTPPTE